MQWTADNNATPPMFHELRDGRKKMALVRRVSGKWIKRKGQSVYQHRYQVVQRWVGGCGDALGPVFPSLRKAKQYAEGMFTS